MKLFTIGPAQMYDHTLQTRAQQIPYFRTDEFSQMMLETDRLLKKFAGTDESSQTIYLTASGTAAMEAAVINCFGPSDKLLVINGGSFGARFVQICAIHGIDHVAINLAYGRALSAQDLSPFENQGFTGLLVNIHETSTGQLYDIGMLSAFCRRNGLLLMVDAISSFFADPFEMDRYGIDAAILSSQKGLCLAPGLSMVLLNARTVQERVMKLQPNTLYFRFADYIENIKRGQTPFTPAVGILCELHEMLRFIDEQGLASRLSSVARLCSHFRSLLRSLPVSIPAFPLSNAMTPVVFEEEIALELFEKLKREHQIYVNPTGGSLGKKVMRVAHIGNLTTQDNQLLADTIQSYLN